MKKVSVDQYVYRVLNKRIILTAIILLLLVAGYAYWQGLANFKQHVNVIAENRIKLLNYQVSNAIQTKNISTTQAVDEVVKSHEQIAFSHQSGFFIYGAVTDQQGHPLATWYNKIFNQREKLERYVNNELSRVNINIHRRYMNLIHLDGQKAFLFIAPFYNAQGNIVGQVKAIFALSPELQKDFIHKILYAFLFGLLLIATTFAIIYPTVIKLTSKLGTAYHNVLDANLEMLELLGATIAKKDSDTSDHNYRVTLMTVKFGEKLGLDKQKIPSLIKGAFLHDVGKIGIPDNILLKPDKLTDEEFEVMKTHVNIGSDIISRAAWLKDANDVVLFHHEKINGSGYPFGLSNHEIPLNARIFAIIDVFDALTSKRPYKEPFPFEKAIQILNDGAGVHFDKELLGHFEEIAQELYHSIREMSFEQLRDELKHLTMYYFRSSLKDVEY